MATLSTVLARFNGDYSTLFTPQGGNLLHDGTSWKITKQRISTKDQQTYFDQLAQTIAHQGIEQVSRPEAFVTRFNNVRPHQKMTTSPNKDGNILFYSKTSGYEWLSNLLPSFVYIEGLAFLSSEHAYQYLKAMAIDPSRADAIRFAITPLEARKKRVQWDNVFDRVAVMERVLQAKFAQNPPLAQALRETKNIQLVEDTDDAFWGRGSEEQPGKNTLGMLLMRIRHLI